MKRIFLFLLVLSTFAISSKAQIIVGMDFTGQVPFDNRPQTKEFVFAGGWRLSTLYKIPMSDNYSMVSGLEFNRTIKKGVYFPYSYSGHYKMASLFLPVLLSRGFSIINDSKIMVSIGPVASFLLSEKYNYSKNESSDVTRMNLLDPKYGAVCQRWNIGPRIKFAIDFKSHYSIGFDYTLLVLPVVRQINFNQYLTQGALGVAYTF